MDSEKKVRIKNNLGGKKKKKKNPSEFHTLTNIQSRVFSQMEKIVLFMEFLGSKLPSGFFSNISHIVFKS